MKIVSFNVNSIRKRLESGQLRDLVKKHKPAIIGLQETKVQDHEFPEEEINKLGYNVAFMGEPTHYGVALMVHKDNYEMLDVCKGFPNETQDTQTRLIEARVPLKDGRNLFVLNGYFPNGEMRSHERKFPYKQRFYARLTKYMQEKFKKDDLVAVIGDMNISPRDEDIGIGEENRLRWLKQGKCSFLPEEREMLSKLMDWGLQDTFLQRKVDNDERYSWFDYRSRGFDREPRRGLRIDLILATSPLNDLCSDSGIDYGIRSMPSPSDHAPVWSSFNLD